MAANDIPSTPVDGNVRVQFVATIADPAAPKLTELNATSSKDLSCYLTAWDGGGDQATINDRRLCTVQAFEAPGEVTRTLSVTYIVNPQSETNNLASTTLVEGSSGYLVHRTGLPFDSAFAVGQKVDVWPVTPGLQLKVNEQGQVSRSTQKQFVRGIVRRDVAVVA